MKTTKLILASFFAALAFTGCDSDDSEQEKVIPKIDKIELGLGNNETGTIGQDFHFNAEVTAGDKIENVQVKIVQRTTETYSKPWSHEITWTQYADAKNATVHKHFDIPEDAAEGKYDFIINVNDQNGTKLEVKKNLTIYKLENIPVNPVASVFTVFINDAFMYRKGKFSDANAKYKNNDVFSSQVSLQGIKGDGIMYLLLINKNVKHSPESVDQIDFKKVIVYDVFEHKNIENAGEFSNIPWDGTQFTRDTPTLKIGAAKDNNSPIQQDLAANKSWVSGDYTFLVLYKNTTYNINFSQSVDLPFAL
ncbi:DUF4625 domain-containing protein [Flavobacterium fluviatile]|uniref:DUF4625 domain-containing protein n=1 Tax=Flavobacterium fluviatile TaxID=1862387 RepID=UPI0013D59915|nr:DUF4625 domain-containing protein [Flavobacterium fluviatile]